MTDILFLILVIVSILLLWLMIYDTNRFVTITYTVSDKRIQNDFRAVLLADLHNKSFGKDNEALIAAIDGLQPEMILVAGDMLTAKPGVDFEVAMDLMQRLSGKYPIYYGNGNHEYRAGIYPEKYGDMHEKYIKGLKELEIQPLINESVRLEEYGVCIYGLEIDRKYYKRFRRPHMSVEYLESVLGQADDDAYGLLLAHNPEYFEAYAKWGADLVLSGHVHGGMVRVPFWGKGVLSPNVSFFPKYDGGSFSLGTSRMLLSRGLGTHTIPIRLFNPGELVCIDFRRAD
ncbi:MAG: metallophosphoesterase [Lachnospiraceae bacterium]|nr:metallophosphoesterase [Lachnospiraceae bacterium]